MRRRIAVWALVVLSAASGAVGAFAQTAPKAGVTFVAYYWKARPGHLDEYSAYITGTAEKIDESARQAGAFDEVRTVMPAPGTVTDWTHLRIFRLKPGQTPDDLAAGLDAATLRVVPDEAQRKANSDRSASLRDLVRREVWTELQR